MRHRLWGLPIVANGYPKIMPTLRRRRFPPTSPSVRAARAFTVAALRRETDDSALISDIELLVSELATNAVKHAGTIFELAVHIDGLVRIDVSDRSPRLPEPRPASPTATSGRGLHLVDAICDRWGVEVHDDYKCVWGEKDMLKDTRPRHTRVLDKAVPTHN